MCRLRGLPEPVTVRADFSDEESAQATRRLLASPDRPTAIIYHTDLTAVTGLEVALEMGLSVPDELSLVAFNDSRLCRLVNPKLTALAHDIPGRGAQAARMLFAAIDAGPGADSQPAEPTGCCPWQHRGVPHALNRPTGPSPARSAADDRPQGDRARPPPCTSGFPRGIPLGAAATAAFQVEGALDADGRTPSVWDTFTAVPGRWTTATGPTSPSTTTAATATTWR